MPRKAILLLTSVGLALPAPRNLAGVFNVCISAHDPLATYPRESTYSR